MENYAKLSLAFTEMLKRTKFMRVRQKKTLIETMSKIMNKGEQYWTVQLEYDGINTLKMCLYKQKGERNISVNTINTIDSVG